MEFTPDSLDKVIYYKGRVWTIYSIDANYNGVFAFHGLKPYPSYRFNSYSHSGNIIYIPRDKELEIIEGEEIDKCLKLEAAAEKKKLNKKYAVEFFAWLTGHSKSFVTKQMNECHHGYLFAPGRLQYEIWKDGKDCLILSHNTQCGYTKLAYFDYVTWEPDDEKYEKSQREWEREILEKYEVKI